MQGQPPAAVRDKQSHHSAAIYAATAKGGAERRDASSDLRLIVERSAHEAEVPLTILPVAMGRSCEVVWRGARSTVATLVDEGRPAVT